MKVRSTNIQNSIIYTSETETSAMAQQQNILALQGSRQAPSTSLQ